MTEINFNTVDKKKVRAYDAIVAALHKEAEAFSVDYISETFTTDYYNRNYTRCDNESMQEAVDTLYTQFNEITTDTAALDAFNQMLEEATGYKA